MRDAVWADGDLCVNFKCTLCVFIAKRQEGQQTTHIFYIYRAKNGSKKKKGCLLNKFTLSWTQSTCPASSRTKPGERTQYKEKWRSDRTKIDRIKKSAWKMAEIAKKISDNSWYAGVAMLRVLSGFWRQFNDIHPFFIIFLIISFFCFSISAVVVNYVVWCVYVFVSASHQRTPNRMVLRACSHLSVIYSVKLIFYPSRISHFYCQIRFLFLAKI